MKLVKKAGTKRYYVGLDLIKILAISWICVYHFLDYYYGWKFGLLYEQGQLVSFFSSNSNAISIVVKLLVSVGFIGVNLFFIASGAGLSLGQNSKQFNFSDFIKRRLIKILPNYWLLLTFILIYQILIGIDINTSDYFTHFLGIHTFWPKFVYSISVPLWFIGIIIQLYLIFPSSFILSKKINSVYFLIIIVLFRLVINYILSNMHFGGRIFTEFIIDFVVGILIGNILIKREGVLNSRKWLLLLPILILELVLIIFYKTSSIVRGIEFILPLTFLIGLTIFVVVYNFGSMLPKEMLQKVASLSYPIYLTHFFLLTDVLPRYENYLLITKFLIFIIGTYIFSIIINKTSELIKFLFFTSNNNT